MIATVTNCGNNLGIQFPKSFLNNVQISEKVALPTPTTRVPHTFVVFHREILPNMIIILDVNNALPSKMQI